MVTRSFAAACAFALLIGCATAGDNTAGNGGDTRLAPRGDDAGGTGDDDGGSPAPAAKDASAPSDAGPKGGAQDSAPTADAALGQVALPFFVGDQFVPSGFMGDSQGSMTAITLTHDAAHCKAPRDPAAGGDCYAVTWAPTPPDGGSSWAGVYWQSPSGNWGASSGKKIAPGATKVSFLAAGAVGGETIQACAGGINANGANASLPHSDSFSVKSPSIVLTTTWTRYEIALQGATYTEVLGGFCWVAAATAATSSTFYLDDVHWE